MTLAPDGHEKNCDIFQLTLLISDLRLQKVVLLPTFKMLLVSYIERACEYLFLLKCSMDSRNCIKHFILVTLSDEPTLIFLGDHSKHKVCPTIQGFIFLWKKSGALKVPREDVLVSEKGLISREVYRTLKANTSFCVFEENLIFV